MSLCLSAGRSAYFLGDGHRFLLFSTSIKPKTANMGDRLDFVLFMSIITFYLTLNRLRPGPISFKFSNLLRV